MIEDTSEDSDRVVPFGLEARDELFAFPREEDIPWVIAGKLGDGDRAGGPPPADGAQIAMIAIQHELILVTQNVKDSVNIDIRLLDPWRTDKDNV